MSESNKNIFVLDKDNKNSTSATRKMAAIFAADVVGYSKLMASNERVPQSTVNIICTFFSINSLNPFIEGPYPSVLRSGIYIS